MTKDQILSLHKEYFSLFGKLPPVSPDGDFYSKELIKRIQAAIATGRPL